MPFYLGVRSAGMILFPLLLPLVSLSANVCRDRCAARLPQRLFAQAPPGCLKRHFTRSTGSSGRLPNPPYGTPPSAPARATFPREYTRKSCPSRCTTIRNGSSGRAKMTHWQTGRMIRAIFLGCAAQQVQPTACRAAHAPRIGQASHSGRTCRSSAAAAIRSRD